MAGDLKNKLLKIQRGDRSVTPKIFNDGDDDDGDGGDDVRMTERRRGSAPRGNARPLPQAQALRGVRRAPRALPLRAPLFRECLRLRLCA